MKRSLPSQTGMPFSVNPPVTRISRQYIKAGYQPLAPGSQPDAPAAAVLGRGDDDDGRTAYPRPPGVDESGKPYYRSPVGDIQVPVSGAVAFQQPVTPHADLSGFFSSPIAKNALDAYRGSAPMPPNNAFARIDAAMQGKEEAAPQPLGTNTSYTGPGISRNRPPA